MTRRPPASLFCDAFYFQEAMELADAGGVTHFAQRLSFDLSDALASHSELPADFLQGSGVAVAQSKSQLQNLALAFG